MTPDYEPLPDDEVDRIDRRCANEGFSLPAASAVSLAREVSVSRKILAALSAEHQPVKWVPSLANSFVGCSSCPGHEGWPCATRRILDGAS